MPRRTTLALKNRYSRLRNKQENKRKRRVSPARSKFDRLPLSETLKEDLTETSFSPATPLYQDGERQAEPESDLHGRRGSDAMRGYIDDMASGTSTMGSVAAADTELGAGWASFSEASNDGCHGAVADGSAFSQLWKSDMGVSTYEECQSLPIDPRMPLEADADLLSLMTDPFTPQTQAFALCYCMHP